MSTDVPKNIKWYLAGPMSGIPQFNIPAFDQATAQLRALGYTVVSPAERDTWETRKASLARAVACDHADLDVSETWGDLMARDMKIIADEVGGIILLPGWERSRGARLESYIGLLAGSQFAVYNDRSVAPMSRNGVQYHIAQGVWEL